MKLSIRGTIILLALFGVCYCEATSDFESLALADTVLQSPAIVMDTAMSASDSLRGKMRHTYTLHPALSGSIIGAGLVIDYFSVPRILGKKGLSDAELQSLNKNVVNGFDRWGLNLDPSQRSRYQSYTSVAFDGIVLLPLLLVGDKHVREDWFNILLMYLETHTITFCFYNLSFLGPTFQDKFRPVTYYDQLSYDQRRAGNNRNSFYSGHVASTAAASFFMAKVYSDYHPEIGSTKYLLYSAALVPPMLMSYLRVKSLDHFPSDCMVGLGIGALCGIVVPELHRIKSKTLSVDLMSSSLGTGLRLTWEPVAKKQGM